jgi:hypothetical protein
LKEKQKIYNVLMHNKFLTPIFTSTYKIPELIKTYSKTLFVVYNSKNEKFELHDLKSFYPGISNWTTYQMTLGKKLDTSVIDKIYANDFSKHGELILKRVDDYNSRLDDWNDKVDRIKMKKASDKVVEYLNGTFDVY